MPLSTKQGGQARTRAGGQEGRAAARGVRALGRRRHRRGGRGGRAGRAAGRARRTRRAPAGSRLQTVLERGHVIVGTGSTNPPWHFEDATGKLVGMDIDLARLLAKGLFEDPEKVEFVLGAADARIPNLVTDKVDVIFQFMTITPGRAQQAEFTIPYYREGVGFMLMKDGEHQTYDELKAGGGDITDLGAAERVHRGVDPPARCRRPRSTSTTASMPRSRRSTRAARRPPRSTSRRSAG